MSADAGHYVDYLDASCVRKNLKLIKISCENDAGDRVLIVANLQARHPIESFIVEIFGDHSVRTRIPYGVSVINSMNHFANEFQCGGYLDARGICAADEVMNRVRDEFRMSDEFDMKLALEFLTTNHS